MSLFTYVAGATLTRGDTKTVKLGIVRREHRDRGHLVRPVDQRAVRQGLPRGQGDSTAGDLPVEHRLHGADRDQPAEPARSGRAENLFPPADATGLTDFSDVFALSNLSTVSGPLASDFLIISQEAGKIDELDRNGNVLSSLTIHTDPGNPLTVSDQQDEGVRWTMTGRSTS